MRGPERRTPDLARRDHRRPVRPVLRVRGLERAGQPHRGGAPSHRDERPRLVHLDLRRAVPDPRLRGRAGLRVPAPRAPPLPAAADGLALVAVVWLDIVAYTTLYTASLLGLTGAATRAARPRMHRPALRRRSTSATRGRSARGRRAGRWRRTEPRGRSHSSGPSALLVTIRDPSDDEECPRTGSPCRR